MRKNKESDDILDTSNYCLFGSEEDSKEEKNDSSSKKIFKEKNGIDFFNPKTQIISSSKKFILNDKNNNNLINSFELFGDFDSNRENIINSPKKENINNDTEISNNVKNKINNDINNNINKFQQMNNNSNNINNFEDVDDNIDNNFNINNYVKKTSSNNLINIDNNCEDEIKNNNRGNRNNFNKSVNINIKNDLENISLNNKHKRFFNNSINCNINNKNDFNNINEFQKSKNNNINNSNKYYNQNRNADYKDYNKRIFINKDNNENQHNFNNDLKNKSGINKNNNNNNNFQPNMQNRQPIKVSKIYRDMNIENLNENKFKTVINSKTVFNKKRIEKSPFRIKETEEERIKREKKEKEQKDIRDKLQCYLCFGKAVKARICLNCKKIACEKCLKQSLEKNGKCKNCQKESNLEDFITLPFMEDLTSFFINNVENNQKHKNKEEMEVEDIQNFNEDNIQNNINENNNQEFIPFCTKHKGERLDYFCLQCSECYCAKCLIFTNPKVAELHKNHKIIEHFDLNKYNISDAIKEYNKLKNSTNDLDKIILDYQMRKKDIEIKKIRAKTVLEVVLKEIEKKYQKEIDDINEELNLLKIKKGNIENAIESVPNSFNNIVEKNDYGQGDSILEELKKLNMKYEDKNELKINFDINNNLCLEWFESDDIKLPLPKGDYIEELVFYEQQLDFIPQQNFRLKMQLLCQNVVFILSFQIEKEEYIKSHPKFYGHFVFKSKDQQKFYSVFYGDIYANEEQVQILTSEIAFDYIKELIDNEDLIIKLNVIKSYYK